MYVCVCNAVTERQIGEAVSKGAVTMRHLRQELGVSAECGRCAVCARDCLRHVLGEQRQSTPKHDSRYRPPNTPLTLEAA